MKSNAACSLALFLSATCMALGADAAKPISLADTPPAVQKAVAARLGEGHVTEILPGTEDGQTVFEVDFTTKAGEDQDFTVADDGTVLNIGVALADTPAAVQKTIQTNLRGWEIEGINKNIADTEISFDVTVSKPGRERSFNIASNGVLSSVGLEVGEAPAAVQTAIKLRIGDGHVDSLEENLDPDGNSFEVEATASDGGGKSFSVAPDGRILSEEVTLEQTPPAVHKTIREQMGDGKILRIDRTFSERNAGVAKFEVEGRKDGRSYDFSVGPRGRFLGLDD